MKNKDSILEFFSRVNDNPSQWRVTKDMEIWIYNLDRNEFTPHCHVFNHDKSEEIEVSLIDWSIINVKSPSNISNDWSRFKTFKDRLNMWLSLPDDNGNSNAYKLFSRWDDNNQDCRLIDFVNKRSNIVISNELKSIFFSARKIFEKYL